MIEFVWVPTMDAYRPEAPTVRPSRQALVLAAVYAVLGAVYLFVSNTLGRRWAPTREAFVYFDLVRDVVFVVLSGLVLGLVAWLLFRRVVSERRQGAIARDRLVAILDATPDLVGVAAPGGGNLYLNRAGRLLIGLPEGTETGWSIFDRVPERCRARFRDEILPAAARDGVWRGEAALVDAAGREIPVSQVIIAHRDARGVVCSYSTIARDITAEKRAQEDLLARTRLLEQANARLREFAHSLSHDVRTSLRSIGSFADLLLEECASRLDPRGRDYVRRIADASRRLHELTEDLLDYEQIGQIEMRREPVDLAAVVARAVARHADELEARGAVVEVDHGLPAVWGDREGLVRAVGHLLSNAAKFVAPDVVPRIRVCADRLDDRARLRVEDNGLGVPAEYGDRIFEVFRRLHPDRRIGGTGIGLAIVRRVVTRMGGRVGVEPNPDGGSRFWIELPAAD